ncbi:MAG TPA: C4-dicarboxylate ABC transporter substrate-binding protein, partial [Sulfitobacter pontiacus]|nr:C4-dicarboxylate ABC transporter substrate-binding protein [Sulfitobacter pontiacus]
DLGTIVNLDKWNSLSDEARKILQDVAIEHEKASAEKLGAVRDEDFAKLEEAGMTVVTLEGEAAQNYLAAATENTWNRMKGLMAESPQGDGNYDKLIELFYDAQKNQ